MNKLFDPLLFGTLIWEKRIKNAPSADEMITGRDAAKQMGISPTTVSRCEHFGTPDVENFLRLALWMRLPGAGELIESINGKPEPDAKEE